MMLVDIFGILRRFLVIIIWVYNIQLRQEYTKLQNNVDFNHHLFGYKYNFSYLIFYTWLTISHGFKCYVAIQKTL